MKRGAKLNENIVSKILDFSNVFEIEEIKTYIVFLNKKIKIIECEMYSLMERPPKKFQRKKYKNHIEKITSLKETLKKLYKEINDEINKIQNIVDKLNAS